MQPAPVFRVDRLYVHVRNHGATIPGKALLDNVSPLTLVWLRFSLALPVLAALFGAETSSMLPRLTA